MFTRDGLLQLREYKNLLRDRDGDFDLVQSIIDRIYRGLCEENAFGFKGGESWTQDRIWKKSQELREGVLDGVPRDV